MKLSLAIVAALLWTALAFAVDNPLPQDESSGQSSTRNLVPDLPAGNAIKSAPQQPLAGKPLPTAGHIRNEENTELGNDEHSCD